jgi:hypothetical protein
MNYEATKKQLSINWDKFVAKEITRQEWNRRNQMTMNSFTKFSQGAK